MSSRLRRSLVLTTLLALSLGVSGAAAPTGLAATPPTIVRGIDVDSTTIPELQELMDANRLTSVQLTQFYLDRIRTLNPTLNAVITVSPTALADAQAADTARRGGDDRPLLGIPIIVKDNVNTTGMPTTAGSWALAESTPDDAFIAAKLKAAGAIIIGKANLSEWANFRSGPSSSGWSGIGGQTNMPYVLDRNPCGSSSGSGVVAAADLAVAAVGTETDGSIVCPSGANGVVGIKPTLGLWSRAGVIPISADQDTAGPMARNVTDAAVLLGAATGVDPDDPATDDRQVTPSPTTPSSSTLMRSTAHGSASGEPAPTTRLGRPCRRADPRRRDRRARGAGRDGRRGHGHRPVGDGQRVPGAAVRVQDRYRDVPRDLRRRHEPGHRRGLPADPRRADRRSTRPIPSSRARGTTSSSSSPRRPTAVTPTAPTLREATTPPVQDADRRAHGRQRPRRDHRA